MWINGNPYPSPEHNVNMWTVLDKLVQQLVIMIWNIMCVYNNMFLFAIYVQHNYSTIVSYRCTMT